MKWILILSVALALVAHQAEGRPTIFTFLRNLFSGGRQNRPRRPRPPIGNFVGGGGHGGGGHGGGGHGGGGHGGTPGHSTVPIVDGEQLFVPPDPNDPNYKDNYYVALPDLTVDTARIADDVRIPPGVRPGQIVSRPQFQQFAPRPQRQRVLPPHHRPRPRPATAPPVEVPDGKLLVTYGGWTPISGPRQPVGRPNPETNVIVDAPIGNRKPSEVVKPVYFDVNPRKPADVSYSEVTVVQDADGNRQIVPVALVNDASVGNPGDVEYEYVYVDE